MYSKRFDITADEGFTIAELLVAVVVLLIVVTAVISGIMFASQSSMVSGRRVDALSLANQQIELARNLPFDEVSTIDPTNGLPAGKVPNDQTIGEYTVHTDVMYGTYGATSAARYKNVHVIVSWDDPIPGSVEMTTSVAGASGTQDYNFGTVTLTIVDEQSPAQPVPWARVTLRDCNGRVYSVFTNSSGFAKFEYVPSGNITLSATKSGYAIDSPASPTCVANTITNYGPVVAHEGQSGTLTLVAPDGSRVQGASVTLTNGPSSPSAKTSDEDGEVLWWQSLIQGTYTINVAHTYYTLSGTEYLTIVNGNTSRTVNLAIKPCTVTATRSSRGTVYVWNSNGTLKTSAATSSSSPYRATFALTNPTIAPTVYYFTKTNAFATTNKLTITAGQTGTITVN